jgi:hypothetical protein
MHYPPPMAGHDGFPLDPMLASLPRTICHSYHYEDPFANYWDSTAIFEMPPKVKAECSVPLLCNLCPKSPTFSDISHLLTHISSKSHLSNLFKLKIRAQGEQEAKDKLDDFEVWYNDNNLDALLSDRLATKDQKKANKDKKNRLSGARASVSATLELQ